MVAPKERNSSCSPGGSGVALLGKLKLLKVTRLWFGTKQLQNAVHKEKLTAVEETGDRVMERSKSRESIQRSIVKPMIGKSIKGPSHRACLRTAGLAIAHVVADKRVPLGIVKRDLEDLRETIDCAINVVSMGLDQDSRVH